MNSRKYPSSDMKILYGLAAGRCSFPDCRKEIVLEETESDSVKQIGKIAHIVGHSNDGPRGDKDYPRAKLDIYENWILLCPLCHDKVDVQANTYSINDLRKIKSEHEEWVRNSLKFEVVNVSFAELSVVTKYLLSGQYGASTSFTVVTPKDKIKKNNLSGEVEALITMGITQVNQVAEFIDKCPDVEFGERLKQGFVKQYEKLKNTEGLIGDYLFFALLDFASGSSRDFKEKAAGLSVLVYLFEKCEVFEK